MDLPFGAPPMDGPWGEEETNFQASRSTPQLTEGKPRSKVTTSMLERASAVYRLASGVEHSDSSMFGGSELKFVESLSKQLDPNFGLLWFERLFISLCLLARIVSTHATDRQLTQREMRDMVRLAHTPSRKGGSLDDASRWWLDRFSVQQRTSWYIEAYVTLWELDEAGNSDGRSFQDSFPFKPTSQSGTTPTSAVGRALIGNCVHFVDDCLRDVIEQALGNRLAVVGSSRSCSQCGYVAVINKACSCRGTDVYCDSACQKLHFPKHKLICSTVLARNS